MNTLSPLSRLRAAYGRAMEATQAMLPDSSASEAAREQWQTVFDILYTEFIAPSLPDPAIKNDTYHQLRRHRVILDNPRITAEQKIERMRNAIARREYRKRNK